MLLAAFSSPRLLHLGSWKYTKAKALFLENGSVHDGVVCDVSFLLPL
jgi:hypothetical protein